MRVTNKMAEGIKKQLESPNALVKIDLDKLLRDLLADRAEMLAACEPIAKCTYATAAGIVVMELELKRLSNYYVRRIAQIVEDSKR